MSSHTTVQGKSRKVATLLNGPRDNDCILFDVYVTIAKTAATTVVIADSQVPTGWYIHIDEYTVTNPGATAWSGTGTTMILEDSAANAIVTFTYDAGANSGIPATTAWVNRTKPATRTYVVETLLLASGVTVSKGIQLRIPTTFDNGTSQVVRLVGSIRPHTSEVFG